MQFRSTFLVLALTYAASGAAPSATIWQQPLTKACMDNDFGLKLLAFLPNGYAIDPTPPVLNNGWEGNGRPCLSSLSLPKNSVPSPTSSSQAAIPASAFGSVCASPTSITQLQPISVPSTCLYSPRYSPNSDSQSQLPSLPAINSDPLLPPPNVPAAPCPLPTGASNQPPGDRVISNRCFCVKTIVRSQPYKRIVKQPTITRYVKKSYVPVTQTVRYNGQGCTGTEPSADQGCIIPQVQPTCANA